MKSEINPRHAAVDAYRQLEQPLQELKTYYYARKRLEPAALIEACGRIGTTLLSSLPADVSGIRFQDMGVDLVIARETEIGALPGRIMNIWEVDACASDRAEAFNMHRTVLFAEPIQEG